MLIFHIDETLDVPHYSEAFRVSFFIHFFHWFMAKKHKPTTMPSHRAEIGVDEAGRGCLAGPLMAAAVFLSEEFDTSGLRDSKLLSPKQREKIFDRIMAANAEGTALVGIGVANVQTIDKVNVLQGTMIAMHHAINAVILHPSSEKYALESHEILIDGNYFRSTEFTNFKTIVRGDELIDCIAAASIVAKVTRDKWMREIADKEFPQYGFKQHKGYATKQHREAILQHGTCGLHRTLFVRNVLNQQAQGA